MKCTKVVSDLSAIKQDTGWLMIVDKHDSLSLVLKVNRICSKIIILLNTVSSVRFNLLQYIAIVDISEHFSNRF